MKLTLAHSPDADDAFMFWPLFQGKIDTQGIEFQDVMSDIEDLNRKAGEKAYDITALSLHAYPYVMENYLLLPVGACFGDNYGPVLVSHKLLKPKQALKMRVGIPGKRTTAFLALKLWERAVTGEGRSGISYTEVPFDQILDRVLEQKLDGGLLIHEGQLNYAEKGLHKVVDLGEWWKKLTGLPLPLGAIAVRRDLPWETQRQVALLIQNSIRYALEHKEEAVQAALPYARGLDAEKAGQFIGMYVNEMTVDWGRKGLKSIRTLLEKGYQYGIITRPTPMDEAVLDLKKAPEVPLPEAPQSDNSGSDDSKRDALV